MKQYLLILFGISLLAISCNKQETSSGPTAEPGIWGQFIATKATRIVVLDEDTVTYTSESAKAFLYETPSTPLPYKNAGTLTINDQQLNQAPDNLYTLTAPSLNLGTACSWYGLTANSGRALNFKDTTAFPEYLATLPYEINKATGFSIKLSDGSFVNTDSVHIYVSDGTGNTYIQQSAALEADSVYFSPLMLAPLTTTNLHGGVISITPYRGMIKVLDNRAFFFTKETNITQSINIY